jgi:hypothetical protein
MTVNAIVSVVRDYISNAAGFGAFSGDGTSGIYIWGAQLEAGSTPSSYIPTSGATVTRPADTLTVPSANLPWPSPVVIGEELVTNGTFDTDLSGWTGRVASNTLISNVSQALRITASSTAGVPWAYQSFTTDVGKVYRFSIESKGGTATGALYKIGTTEYGEQNASGSLSGVVTGTFVATSTTTFITLEPTLSSYTGSEAGDYWDFDNISVREINPLAVSIQMDGRMTYADDGSGVTVNLYNWAESTSNRILDYVGTFSGKTGAVDFFQTASGVADVAAELSPGSYSPGINVPYNIASRHGSTFINGSVDGVALTADTTPTALPDLSSTDLNLAFDYMGTIRTFRVWADDLGDENIEIASATAPVIIGLPTIGVS